MDINYGGSTSPGFCPECGKPPYYAGDVPEGGFQVGFEPYCVCGTKICGECGKRYIPKCKECGKL